MRQVYKSQDISHLRKAAYNLRSPLRYAGGKSRGVFEIFKFIPRGTASIASPFLGGGSLEILCARKNIKVHAFDNFRPLIEFWQCLLSNPKRLADAVREHYPLGKDEFYELQRVHRRSASKYKRAAIYFVLNRASFSGTTLSGGMSPGHPRFTESSIDRLENFKLDGLKIEQADFAQVLSRFSRTLLYLDPPYMIDQRLYGSKRDTNRDFDHAKLSKMLHTRSKWILSYNNSPEVRKLYRGYKFRYPRWAYGMSNDKESREVLILSHDLASA